MEEKKKEEKEEGSQVGEWKEKNDRGPFISSEEKASMIRHPIRRRRNMEEERKEK